MDHSGIAMKSIRTGSETSCTRTTSLIKGYNLRTNRTPSFKMRSSTTAGDEQKDKEPKGKVVVKAEKNNKSSDLNVNKEESKRIETSPLPVHGSGKLLELFPTEVPALSGNKVSTKITAVYVRRAETKDAATAMVTAAPETAEASHTRHRQSRESNTLIKSSLLPVQDSGKPFQLFPPEVPALSVNKISTKIAAVYARKAETKGAATLMVAAAAETAEASQMQYQQSAESNIFFETSPIAVHDSGKLLQLFPTKVPVFSPSNNFQDSVTEQGQSSNPIFVCDICTESRALEESFSVKGCLHKFCNNCVNKYVASRLEENMPHVKCPVPDCKSKLEPDDCRSILPQKVFEKWCEQLCEAAIQGFKKLYCPYKDCSGMLIDDGTQQIKESECPHCRRLFCARCMVPWHSGSDCPKHDSRSEDIGFMNLAKTKLWKRCPKCKMYVERTSGCKYIKCRCGASFCYRCGTSAIDSASHYCNHCQA